ncbi:MAG: metalloregulator ArsR/SmtB family transcription factor [Thermoplasmata archaeon]
MPSRDPLSETFTALANPTRRAILARLARGETTVNDLARPFDLSLPGVSKHLRVLQRAGLISQRRHAQERPCKLEAVPLRDAEEWMQQYRQFWTRRMDRLDTYLRDAQKKKRKDDRNQRGT